MNKLKEIGNKYYQEVEVVMLATNKQGQRGLIICKDEEEILHLYRADKFENKNLTVQHLYFLSNEEIKEGDYYYNDLFNMVDQLIKGGLVTDDLIQTLNKNKHNRKIIATTDISLGLPQPSPQFIQAYIKAYNENKPITKVLVEMEVHTWQDVKGIEQACSLKVNSSNEITIKKVKDSWTREEYSKGLKYAIEQAIQYPELFITGICCDDSKINKFIEENL